MDSRAMAALLFPLITNLLLLLLSPSSSPLLSSSHHHHRRRLPFPLLSLLNLSDTAVAAAVISSLPRKRRRLHSDDPHTQSDSKVNPFMINPDSFPLHFNMTSSSFEWLSGLLEPLLDCRDPVGSPLGLSTELRLGIGLFRLSTGSDYPEISSLFRVSESVARFCEKQLCRVLCTNFRFWVGFPGSDELDTVSGGFRTLTGLPNCVGVIGCTRFEIMREEDDGIRVPRSSDEKRGAVAAQVIVDCSCRILSIVAGFDGDRDDWSVLKSSSLYKDVTEGRLLNSETVCIDRVDVPQYLVGADGTYPLLPWLQVPFSDPASGSSEESFNESCALMRRLMLRTVASLRNWGVLSGAINGGYRNAVACIGACAILHNALLMREDFSALGDDGAVDDQGVSGQGLRTCWEDKGSDQSRLGHENRSVLARKAKQCRMLRESDS